jgi:hypothetical protein
MEKKENPIDRLFAQKLRDHEIKPRDAAWEKLQVRLPQATGRRTRPLWGYLAVAASVAALVLAGVWLGRDELPDTGGTEIAQTTPPVRRAQPTPTETVPAPPANDTATKTVETGAPERVAPAPQVAQQRVPTRSAEAERYPAGRRQPGAGVPVIQPAPESVPVLSQPQPQLAQTEKKPEEAPKSAAATPTVFVMHVTEPPLLAEAAPTSPTIQENQVAQAEPAQPKKGKFLNRVVKNLKHLKQGEWKEAGLDAGGLLARAEEKILRK